MSGEGRPPQEEGRTRRAGRASRPGSAKTAPWFSSGSSWPTSATSPMPGSCCGSSAGTTTPCWVAPSSRSHISEKSWRPLRPGGWGRRRHQIKEAKVHPGVCPYCAVGCIQLVYSKGDKIIDIEGHPDTPHTLGRLCPKGSATIQLSNNPLRPTKAMYRPPNSDKWEEKPLDWMYEQIAKRYYGARERYFVEKEKDKDGKEVAVHRAGRLQRAPLGAGQALCLPDRPRPRRRPAPAPLRLARALCAGRHQDGQGPRRGAGQARFLSLLRGAGARAHARVHGALCPPAGSEGAPARAGLGRQFPPSHGTETWSAVWSRSAAEPGRQSGWGSSWPGATAPWRAGQHRPGGWCSYVCSTGLTAELPNA
jgi:hypothetical protein